MSVHSAASDRPHVVVEREALAVLWKLFLFVTTAWFLYVLGTTVSNDAAEYEIIWDRLQETNFLDAWRSGRFEIASLFVYWLLAQMFSPGMTFYLTGAIAFSIKYHLLNKYVRYPALAVLVYAALFLHVHDANQVRAALGACFVMYALLAPQTGRGYLFLTAVATLFHYSGLIIGLLYFVGRPIIGVGIIVGASLVWDAMITSSATLAFALIFLSNPAGEVSFINSIFIMQTVIAVVAIANWRGLSEAQKKGAYLLLCGAVIYVAFYNNPTMAHRLRELSMLGLFPLLFLRERKPSSADVIIWLCMGYILVYNVWIVAAELYHVIAGS